MTKSQHTAWRTAIEDRFYEIPTELDFPKRPKWTSKDEAWEEETTISAATRAHDSKLPLPTSRYRTILSRSITASINLLDPGTINLPYTISNAKIRKFISTRTIQKAFNMYIAPER